MQQDDLNLVSAQNAHRSSPLSRLGQSPDRLTECALWGLRFTPVCEWPAAEWRVQHCLFECRCGSLHMVWVGTSFGTHPGVRLQELCVFICVDKTARLLSSKCVRCFMLVDVVARQPRPHLVLSVFTTWPQVPREARVQTPASVCPHVLSSSVLEAWDQVCERKTHLTVRGSHHRAGAVTVTAVLAAGVGTSGVPQDHADPSLCPALMLCPPQPCRPRPAVCRNASGQRWPSCPMLAWGRMGFSAIGDEYHVAAHPGLV